MHKVLPNDGAEIKKLLVKLNMFLYNCIVNCTLAASLGNTAMLS